MALPHAGGMPEEPILRAFQNIQVKNAVLTWDGEPDPENRRWQGDLSESAAAGHGRRRSSSSAIRRLLAGLFMRALLATRRRRRFGLRIRR